MYKLQLEKWGLSVFFIGFFAMIFIGAWRFTTESSMFPVFLSAFALILLVRFVIQPTRHPSVNRVAEQGTDSHDTDTSADTEKSGVYVVFLYTGICVLLAYLFGFYIASVVSILLYVYWVRKSFTNIAWAVIILLFVILGLVYMFDVSFGHYYANGVLFKVHN